LTVRRVRSKRTPLGSLGSLDTLLQTLQEGIAMISDRLRAAVDRAAQLPVETQDALAVALEQALEQTQVEQQTPPPLAPEVREAFERALSENAATLAYLKDR
jgi:hypothetical protein